MKDLKEILESLFDSKTQTMESLFDKDIVEKDPLDWSWFTIKNPKERYDLFLEISTMIWDPEDYWPDWLIDNYKEHELEFDYIVQALRSAFNKQGGESWIRIDEYNFEEMCNEMTEDEIEYQNFQLDKFFSNANETEIGSLFTVGKGKFPKAIEFILKGTGLWEQKGPLGTIIKSPKQWALDYWHQSSQTLSIYICPKGLDPIVKKLLYD